jgi:hypothetical protein
MGVVTLFLLGKLRVLQREQWQMLSLLVSLAPCALATCIAVSTPQAVVSQQASFAVNRPDQYSLSLCADLAPHRLPPQFQRRQRRHLSGGRLAPQHPAVDEFNYQLTNRPTLHSTAFHLLGGVRTPVLPAAPHCL